MMMEISAERRKYHELLESFSKRVFPNSVVYDIGRSRYHDYKYLFYECDFKTIDCDVTKKPDIFMNIEGINEHNIDEYLPQCHALLCNGVIEQCWDPMELIRSCCALVRSQGLALFGFVLLGYPEHDFDRFRFTKQGAICALKQCGFNIEDSYIVKRDNVPSYIYVVCKKL